MIYDDLIPTIFCTEISFVGKFINQEPYLAISQDCCMLICIVLDPKWVFPFAGPQSLRVLVQVMKCRSLLLRYIMLAVDTQASTRILYGAFM